MAISGRAILLTLAIGIAGFTVITIRSQLQQPEAGPQKVEARVLVARRDLAVGTFVQGVQDLEFAPMPEGADAATATPTATNENGDAQATLMPVKEPYFLESNVRLEDFNGAVVRRPLKAGDPVPQTALMKAGEGGFLSAVLEPGMRAVSIAVNATTGNAGFVSPGDRVDLIVTHRFKSSSSNDESVVSETFVRDLRIVAVDQMTDNPDNKAILAKTVTVECSPREAEQIAVASEMGKISLALRSLTKADRPTRKEEEAAAAMASQQQAPEGDVVKLYGAGDEAPGFTRDSDLSSLLERRVLSVPRVQVIRGEKTETIDFATSP